MASYNRVILMGNLTRDPEVKYSQGGSAIAKFAVAVNRRYKSGEELKEEVGFFDIVVFGKQAENCGEYLKKGRGVLVEGRLQQDRWEDKETGAKRSRVLVVAQSVQFLGSGSGSGGGQGRGGESPAGAPDEGLSDIPDAEDVPF
jgi:single-strand DNA-binding protein